jgi:hypothetical protein
LSGATLRKRPQAAIAASFETFTGCEKDRALIRNCRKDFTSGFLHYETTLPSQARDGFNEV